MHDVSVVLRVQFQRRKKLRDVADLAYDCGDI